jgi:hypothetical protein
MVILIPNLFSLDLKVAKIGQCLILKRAMNVRRVHFFYEVGEKIQLAAILKYLLNHHLETLKDKIKHFTLLSL